jgi:branched-chain amino acid transport system permease protein
MTDPTEPTTPRTAVAGTVTRTTPASRVVTVAAPVVVALLASLPYVAVPSITRALVTLFALVVMASMWNLIAGYGGMISVGQQGFIGVGAYTVLAADVAGISPFLAIPLAVIVAAVLSLPTTALVFRLSGGYFAVGTWVVAEVYRLLTVEIGAVGGGSGASLRGLTALNPVLRGAIVYWCALGAAVLAVLVVYLIMRSPLGLALTAIRDDPIAADSLGVRVRLAKRLVFVIAAGGCGMAGALIVLDSLRVQPDSIYSVQWSAFMIFMVVIGGIGTLEGPVLGAIVLFILQQTLEPYGVWYLVALGVAAIAAALYARRGLWGLLTGRRDLRLLPTGYRVVGRPRLFTEPRA